MWSTKLKDLLVAAEENIVAAWKEYDKACLNLEVRLVGEPMDDVVERGLNKAKDYTIKRCGDACDGVVAGWKEKD